MIASTSTTVTTWLDAQLSQQGADGTHMDRHVRWFRREIAVRVAQRLTSEIFVVAIITLVALLAQGRSTGPALIGMLLVMPVFTLARVGLALTANPLNSAYLLRWPHPESTVTNATPTSSGTPADALLRQFGFSLRGAFDEWGGATTNVYTMASNQIIVTTSDDDDTMAISIMSDRRLVVTTTLMIPPHERLIANCVGPRDIRSLLSSHIDLVKSLRAQGAVGVCSMDQVIEVLAIEWAAWDQIGPFLGPFVGLGRAQPTLLQVRVAGKDVLQRTAAARPIITAEGISLEAASAGSLPDHPGDHHNAHQLQTEVDRPAIARSERAVIPPTTIDRAA